MRLMSRLNRICAMLYTTHRIVLIQAIYHKAAAAVVGALAAKQIEDDFSRR